MLVSFYVISYNQSEFIERTMGAALSQDYSPLEIIVSDDCSTDDTWKKIQQIARAYSGSHKLVVRQNQKNLGVSAHINEIWRECHGDWIVASAGDDTSHPQRVSRIVNVVKQNPEIKLVQSWLNEVDDKGHLLYVNSLGDSFQRTNEEIKKRNILNRLNGESLIYHGAAMAYSRDLVNSFPPLPHGVIHEDKILDIRAELIGDVAWIGEPLVDHCNHSGQVTDYTSRNILVDVAWLRSKGQLWSDIVTNEQNIIDLKQTKSPLNPDIAKVNKYILNLKNSGNSKSYKYRMVYGGWVNRVLLFINALIFNKLADFRLARIEFIYIFFPRWSFFLVDKLRSCLQ